LSHLFLKDHPFVEHTSLDLIPNRKMSRRKMAPALPLQIRGGRLMCAPSMHENFNNEGEGQ
jgi:hypothetical protein